MSRNAPPDYYSILGVSDKATAQQIRDAYKRAALKSHPDRVPADSPERKQRTARFQLVNDAYFTLSDAGRRREYDTQRRLFGMTGAKNGGYGGYSDNSSDAGSSDTYAGSDGSWAWDFFSQPPGAAGSASGSASGRKTAEETQNARKQNEDAQFADVFEEMLREEGMAEPGNNNNQNATGKFWSLLGGMSGGALGFIVGNVPGLLAGAVAGNRLGAVRDAKGKSVYAVFQELPPDDRARMLSQLAMRVFSHAMSN